MALARAIVLEPKILCLDEPLSNLDAKLRIGLRGELKRLQKDLGITTLYVTHDQEEALTLSDRIAVFNNGYIEQEGLPTISTIFEYNGVVTKYSLVCMGNLSSVWRKMTDTFFTRQAVRWICTSIQKTSCSFG